MHLHTIAAFAFLFWRLEAPSEWYFLGPNRTAAVLAVVWLQPVLLALLAWITTRKSRRMLAVSREQWATAAKFHHRSFSLLRIALVAGFGATTLLSPWPDWISLLQVAPALQIFSDLLVLSTYLLGAVALWLVAYPVERILMGADDAGFPVDTSHPGWRLPAYLDFHIRHHLLVIAGPMLVILFASNMSRGYEDALREWSGSYWAPDVLLGLAAVVVFLLAPFMLRRLWRTTPLAEGPLRQELLKLCTRLRLRCREILLWKSNGLMINAAVMGIVPAARYVLLSDALLAAMTPRQVEAIFGHEAGHVRHRHMQYFLVFALIGWLTAGAATEAFSWWFDRGERMSADSVMVIQGIGILITFLFWMTGFGWLSRRFERQADLFGARCVTPEPGHCLLPCSVHHGAGLRSDQPERVCATGAAIFASALDKVATLSGIGHDEPSWRHASVGTRIYFLHSAAGDPSRAIGFERLVRRVKATLMTVAVLGSAGAVYYWTSVRPVQVPLMAKSP